MRRAFLGFVSAVLVGVLASGGLLAWGSSRIDRHLVDGLASNTAAADEPAVRRVNVLVVGSDSREGMTPAQIRSFGTGRAEGNRTDSLMLVQLEVNGSGRGAVLSFPRDLRVTRCDGSEGRINAAHEVGLQRDGDGPSCLVQTVSDLTGIPVHHYVEVSFAGFLQVVDAIGGVNLYLDEPISDENAHIDLPAGCVRLNGPDALGFVRARHVDNDFGRIARQQRFVKETLRQAADVGVLANPAKLLKIVDGAASAVDTDSTLTLAGMREIAMGMRKLTADGLAVHTVPSDSQRIGGTWYVEARTEPAEGLYAAFRDGSILDAPREDPDDEAVPAPVLVHNASGKAGLAAAAAAALEGRGFQVAEVGNAPVDDLAMTRITHPPHLATAAEELAELFPGAVVVAGAPTDSLTLDLGTEMTPDAISSIASSPTPEPTGDAESPVSSPAVEATEAPESASDEYAGARAGSADC